MFAALKASKLNTLSATLEGRPFRVFLTPAAERALAARTTPLIAEMEYYFSCLIRLRVLFYEDDPDHNTTRASDQLAIRFRPVMSRRCDLHAVHGRSPLEDFPLVKRAPYVPYWLRLDFRKGAWVGEFGYKSNMPI